MTLRRYPQMHIRKAKKRPASTRLQGTDLRAHWGPCLACLVVSNRLPVTVHTAQGRASVTASAGGLATGLRGAFDRSHGGGSAGLAASPGSTTAARDEVLAGLADLRCVPVELTAEEVRSYYEDFSNGVLWPLFHYLLDRIPHAVHRVGRLSRVNAKFADAVVAAYQPGDTVWVHDYHLLLLPGCCASACRTRASASSCTSRSPRPRCSACCRGAPRSSAACIGADLIGFHTPAYARNFSAGGRAPARPRADVRRAAGRRPPRPLRRLPDGHRRRRVRRARAEPLESSTSAPASACSSASTASTTPRASAGA
jgi:hypothetical protein